MPFLNQFAGSRGKKKWEGDSTPPTPSKEVEAKDEKPVLESLPEAERPKSAADIYLDNLAMVSESDGVKKELEALGIPLVYEEKVPEGVTDLTTTISKVRQHF